MRHRGHSRRHDHVVPEEAAPSLAGAVLTSLCLALELTAHLGRLGYELLRQAAQLTPRLVGDQTRILF